MLLTCSAQFVLGLGSKFFIGLQFADCHVKYKRLYLCGLMGGLLVFHEGGWACGWAEAGFGGCRCISFGF